ncbi:MAG TPA: hypothetical protein VN704_00695 [Verrucomicrobiae bacterium]|nr:hypothetical protein [Verrucomicrobiae bacterium]
MEKAADLFVQSPKIQNIDILADKLPQIRKVEYEEYIPYFFEVIIMIIECKLYFEI